MIISSPFAIILSAEEHQQLTLRAHADRTAHRDLIRAQIILSAAADQSSAAIAAEVDVQLVTRPQAIMAGEAARRGVVASVSASRCVNGFNANEFGAHQSRSERSGAARTAGRTRAAGRRPAPALDQH